MSVSIWTYHIYKDTSSPSFTTIRTSGGSTPSSRPPTDLSRSVKSTASGIYTATHVITGMCYAGRYCRDIIYRVVWRSMLCLMYRTLFCFVHYVVCVKLSSCDGLPLTLYTFSSSWCHCRLCHAGPTGRVGEQSVPSFCTIYVTKFMYPSPMFWSHLTLGIMNRFKTTPTPTATREAHTQAWMHVNVDYVFNWDRESTDPLLLYHPLTRPESRHILLTHSHNGNLQALCLSPRTWWYCAYNPTHTTCPHAIVCFLKRKQLCRLTNDILTFRITFQRQKGSQRQELDTGSALVHDQRNVRLHKENGKREDKKAAIDYHGPIWCCIVLPYSLTHPLTVPTLTRILWQVRSMH